MTGTSTAPGPGRKKPGLGRLLLGGFILALALYVAGFAFDQHLRTRGGPWQVTFTSADSGAPEIIVNQPHLQIVDLRIVFAGERATNATTTIRFDQPGKAIPFGTVKYEDLTYLPGVVTFDLFGHEIELLPRTLYLNRHAHPWQSRTQIDLSVADRPGRLAEPLPRKRRWL